MQVPRFCVAKFRFLTLQIFPVIFQLPIDLPCLLGVITFYFWVRLDFIISIFCHFKYSCKIISVYRQICILFIILNCKIFNYSYVITIATGKFKTKKCLPSLLLWWSYDVAAADSNIIELLMITYLRRITLYVVLRDRYFCSIYEDIWIKLICN